MAESAGYNPYRKANGEFASKDEIGGLEAKISSDLRAAEEAGDSQRAEQIRNYVTGSMPESPLGVSFLTDQYGDLPTQRKSAIEPLTLASVYHESWRKNRILEDGSFEPRVKSTSDREWILQNGTDTVDIANTSFADLPSDWQRENAEAAQVVADYLESHRVDLDDPRSRSAAGQHVHEAWLSRNSWAAGGELDVHFDSLSLEEQEKDIDQVRLGQGLL